LSASGIPAARFVFEGFLPRQAAERRRRLEALRADPRAVVFYEAPTRLVATLRELAGALADRPAAVARELTKLHEEWFRGSLADAAARFAAAPPRGECVIVLAGAVEGDEETDADDLVADARRLLEAQLSERDSARALVVQRGVSRREAYAAVLEAGKRR